LSLLKAPILKKDVEERKPDFLIVVGTVQKVGFLDTLPSAEIENRLKIMVIE
jgi:hypothetical protein